MKGIKICKRFAAFCITLAMMVTALAVPISTNAATVPVTVMVSKAGQVVDSMTFNGVTVKAIYIPRNDSNASEMWDDPVYCCAALVSKFYKAVYGCTVYNLWPGSTPLSDVGYFTKVKTPQVGDIYGNSSHWAIVKQINGTEVVLFEQNWTWYDSNGCYAKYNRTVDLSNLESDVNFFRYSGAFKYTKPVLTTAFATLENLSKPFSWTASSDAVSSTLNIYEYNANGTYNENNLISSTTNIVGGSTSVTLPMGHYAAQVLNYSSSNEISESDIKEFYVVGEPLATDVQIKDLMTVVAGKTKNISRKMLPANTNDVLTWTSSNNSVASVSNSGVVTGVSAGTATITAKAVSGVKDTCTVTVKPGTVANLKASGSSKKSITLNWDSVSNVTGYRVFRYDKAKKKYVKISDLKSNSYKVWGLNKASAYKFKVRAYKNSNKKSYVGKYSSVLSAFTRPDKPKYLTAYQKGSETTVKLSWTSTKGAKGYAVYASEDGGSFVKIKTVSGKKHSATLKNLKRGTSYTFKLKAIKKISGVDIYSGASNKAYAVTKPAKVKGVVAERISDGSVALSWKPVNGAAKYQIYMKSGSSYIRVKSVSASKVKTKINNLYDNKKHTFKVRAYKLNGGYKYFGKFSDEVKA